MSDFRTFDQARTTELYVERHKWFFHYYELTDGQFIYGRLSIKKGYKRYAVVETAEGIITLKSKGWLKRNLLIKKGEDETIGALMPQTWKRDVILEMDNGFKATYHHAKIFSRSFSLIHEIYGDLLSITRLWWSFSRPFKVSFKSTIKIDSMPSVPYLALTGLYLTLLRQQQAAA